MVKRAKLKFEQKLHLTIRQIPGCHGQCLSPQPATLPPTPNYGVRIRLQYTSSGVRTMDVGSKKVGKYPRIKFASDNVMQLKKVVEWENFRKKNWVVLVSAWHG